MNGRQIYHKSLPATHHPPILHKFSKNIVHSSAILILALAAPSCVKLTWRDRALQERPDRTTPELAFETFRAAIRCDDPLLGYKMLSEAMKEREGIVGVTFSAGWDAFFNKHPFARLAGNAEITDKHAVGGQILMIAKAHGHTIESLWTREYYYEISLKNGDKIDGFLEHSIAEQLEKSKELPELIARCNDMRLSEVEVKDVTGFLLASEWKLLKFEEQQPSK